MTDIGELVNPHIELEKHDSDCYFCTKEEKDPLPEENDPDNNFNEDTLIGLATAKGGIKHKNDSGRLGDACAPPPDDGRYHAAAKEAGWWITEPNWKWYLKLEFAAHHLIPGDASLQKSKLFKDSRNGLKTKGKAVGNVGYNVNAKINGVWLPGNYAFANEEQKAAGKGWGTEGGDFKEWSDVEPQNYASTAIKRTGSQFHDSHTDYNRIVKKTLDQIHNKLKKTKNVPWCPEAGKKTEKEKPLYVLVGRLATLSGRMRKMLVFPIDNWKTNIYTSAFARKWMQAHNAARS